MVFSGAWVLSPLWAVISTLSLHPSPVRSFARTRTGIMDTISTAPKRAAAMFFFRIILPLLTILTRLTILTFRTISTFRIISKLHLYSFSNAVYSGSPSSETSNARRIWPSPAGQTTDFISRTVIRSSPVSRPHIRGESGSCNPRFTST